MSPVDQKRASEIFAEVIGYALNERLAFLDTLREESPELTAQVEQMISDHDSAEATCLLEDAGKDSDETAIEPLQQSPEETMAYVSGASQASRRPGSQQAEGQPPMPLLADDYELLDELGKGGMGVVYRAFQRSLRKHVAVKIIPSRLIQSPEESARFYLEAEAAARLDHPGIVTVHEVGERNNVHYYVMALVSGGSLNEFVGRDKNKRDKERLLPRRSAEIMEKVSRAVQYAHDHAVIHRDIKPANIMLDEEGLPRLTDFGLAKLTNTDDNLTMTGQVMGTPSYMAPEQAGGASQDVSNRTDVYSLGATLYALLAGKAPFSGETLFNTLQQVQTMPPAPLPAAVPLDLRTICLKCLAKSPADRYQSAGRLADDLRRFLDGFPIAARPVGPLQRALRWTRRNPLIASLIGLVAVTLVTATIVSTSLYLRAEEETSKLYAQIEEGYLFATEVIADEPGMEKIKRIHFDVARKAFERQLASGKLPIAKTAEVTYKLGTVEASLGNSEAARLSFDRALKLQGQLLEQSASRDKRIDLLMALGQTHREYARLGASMWEEATKAQLLGDQVHSSEEIAAALQLWHKHAEKTVELRSEAVQTDPDNAELARKHANGVMNLGIAKVEDARLANDKERLEQSMQLLQEAQSMRDAIVTSHPEPVKVQVDLAIGYAALADAKSLAASMTAEEEEGLKLKEESLQLRIEAAKTIAAIPAGLRDNRTEWRLANCYRLCGESYIELQRIDEAIASYRQMLDVTQHLAIRHPHVARYRIAVAQAQYMLSQLLQAIADHTWSSVFGQCQDTLAEGLIVSPKNRELADLLVEYSVAMSEELVGLKVPELAVSHLDRAAELLEKLPTATREQPFLIEAIDILQKAREKILDEAESSAV